MTARSTRSMPPPSAGQPASAHNGGSGITLAVIVSCYLMVGLDSTIVNTALPKIQQELAFTPYGLSWVLNAYMLAFGGFLLLGGRSGDILGRRRVFIIGVAIFTIGSLLGGLAMASWWLIAARVLQGLGAAIAAPSTLALIVANFPAGSPRNRALSIYSAVAGAGGSVGLILGGVLTELASWRWVLFINVPVGVGIIACAPFFIRETPPRTGRFDVLGAATSTLSMTSLVFAFVQAPARGWTNVTTLAAFGVGIALMIAFLLIERRADHPVTPLSLFRDRRRSGALLNMLLLSAAMFGTFFFLIQFLQDVRAFRPAMAGIAFLPVTVTMFTTARCVPMLMRRFGLRAVMVTGTALIVAADVLFSRVSTGTGYLAGILVPMLLLGLGVGSNFMPLNMTILESVDSSEAGAASGLAQSMQWVGGSLGLGILVSVFGLTSGKADGHGTSELLARGMSGIFTASAVFAGCAMVVALFVITARAPRRAGDQPPSAKQRNVMSHMTTGLEPVDYPSMRPGRIEPDPVLAELRRSRPVCRVRLPYGKDGWLVTRYADVQTVYSDPRFSRAAAITPDVPRVSPFVPRPDSMLSMDPPEHTRLRRLMMKAFTARRVEMLRPGTERITSGLLDGIVTQGAPADLVSELCLPLPVMVICELLGVPYVDRRLIQEWSTAFTSVTELTPEQVQQAYTSLREYVANLVEQRRRAPTDDFLGALVEARDSGDRLSEDELVTMTVFLLVAGHETTVTQLANSLYLLLVRPEEMASLRARPHLMPTAVDELLRYIPIFASATLARVALEDVEISGVLIRKGDAVLVSDPAASWDETVFAEPGALDFTRSPNPHMAFGHGPHRCLGSQLARMELQVALRAVTERFEGLRLAVPPEQVPWKSGKTTHGVAELPVVW